MSNGITAPFFLQHFTDPTTNKPVSGGTVEYYVGGSTNIPKLVYADVELTNSLGNVLTLDAGGYAPQYFMLSGYYKIVLRRANGSLVYTRDYVEGGANSSDGDHKFAINQSDENAGGAGFFQDKVVDSVAIEWEVVDIGDGVLQAKANLTDEATAKPIGPAGGDLFGTYPNPRVKELTGVPAMLTPSIAGFNWKQSGGWASGAGIGFGFGYVNGVQTRVWMAISQLGELQVSYDEWKSEVYIPEGMPYRNSFTDYDGNTQLYNDVYSKFAGRYAAVSYLEIPGTGKYCWVFGAEGALRGLEAVSTNFYANGAPKLENMFAWSYNGTDPNTINSNGTVMVFTGNSSTINYAEAADIDWDNKIISAHSATVTGTNAASRGVIGGNGCNGSSFMCVGRDSGLVMQSADGINWTVVDVLSNKFQDGSSMTKTSVNEYTNALPMNTNAGYSPAWGTNGNAWGGMLYANDMWIVVNGKPAPSTINTAWSPFMFSYDKSNWNGYMPTPDELAVNYSYSMYKIAYGHGKTFATNSDPFQDYKNQPAIYRLLMDEIPAHRKLVAEKGMDVIGTLAILDLPNASSLATDEDGNVIAGEGAVAQIGDAPKVDYVFSPFDGGTRKWVPNGKASGVVENVLGPLVRDNLNRTITVPAYTVQLFDNPNFLGQPLRYEVAESTHDVFDNNVRLFATAKYISPGVAQTVMTGSVSDLNLSNQAPLFAVELTTDVEGNDEIHAIEFDTQGEGLAQKTTVMLTRTEPYRRTKEGGLIISSNNLYITVNEAIVYAATTPIVVYNFDSSNINDRLVHSYKVSGSWQYAVETTGKFNNTHYSNGSNLVEMGTNKYKNVWVYRSIGDDVECFYIDGLQYNTQNEALAETMPVPPSLLDWHCMLVGRITLQKGQVTGYTVQSAFINPFAGSSSTSGYIRNQDTSGTNDSPGNIFAAPDATWKIRYEDLATPANNVDWFSVSKDMLKLQALDINNPALIGYQAELTPSALALRGRPGTSYGIYNAAVIMSREQFNWVPNVNGAWYTFFHQDLGGGTAQAQGGYSFPRLRFRVSPTDTVSAELVNKIVDSNGNELSQAQNGSYGSALVIPTTQIAGTPNGQELFSYSLYETKNAISQAGTATGNNYGNRGFAFIAMSSRRFKKARMMISQTGGTYMRMAIYSDNFTLIAKSPRTEVYGGIMSFDLNLNASNQPVDGAVLIGGNRYYLAYWTDDTTGNLKFACLSGRNTESDSPQAQLYDLANEMPSPLGTSGTRTAFRPWMSIYEA